jgi:hypothetical protein
VRLGDEGQAETEPMRPEAATYLIHGAFRACAPSRIDVDEIGRFDKPG